MAFDRTNLSGNLGAGSNAPKLFTCTSADAKAAIIAADYFLDAYDVLAVGDIILCTGSDATVALAVTASSSTTVTTAYVAVA